MNLARLGSRRLIRWASDAVNIVADGNSIMAGVFASSSAHYIPTVACATAPISAGGITPVNKGIGGQSWDDMTSNHSDVDSSYVAGKINILALFEGTNQIINVGSSGAVSATKAQTYISAVKAVHPWRVVLMTCTPGNRSGAAGRTVAQVNAEIDAYNTLLRANYKTYGAEALCEVRPVGGPYSISSYTNSDFTAINAYYYSVEAAGGNQLHPSDTGYDWLGQQLAATLATMRIR